MWISPESGGFPRGAWATSIPPWNPSNMLMRDLARVFYYNPSRWSDPLTHFVALCNDRRPLFSQYAGSQTYFKPDGRVNAIAAGKAGFL